MIQEVHQWRQYHVRFLLNSVALLLLTQRYLTLTFDLGDEEMTELVNTLSDLWRETVQSTTQLQTYINRSIICVRFNGKISASLTSMQISR